MYEKYTGLPDTSKPVSTNHGRAERAGSNGYTQNAGNERYDMYDAYAGPQRGGSSSRGGSSGGRSGSRSSRSRKKKMRQRRIALLCTTVVILGLLALAVTILVKSCSRVEEPDPVSDVFRAEVYVNSANLAGKTLEEARAQLEPGEQYTINNIAVNLSGNGFSAVISGPDMGAVTNLEEVLATAFAGTSGQSYYTAVSFDEGALAARLDEINSTLSTAPTDASVSYVIGDDGQPDFTYAEGTPGYGIDVDAAKALVLEALAAGRYQTSVEPPLTTLPPAVTVEDAKAHMSLIGSFTTTYDFKGTAEDTEEQRTIMIPNRAFNVEKSAELINGQVVKPGRTWSFNDTVGDRTEKNGWKEANGIFGGDRFTYQYGGGVCQVSTTLYNAVMQCYPSIKIVERRKHSIASTYVDKGLDATVDTNHIDFRFKNTSEYPLYIFAYSTTNRKYTKRKRDITVLIYGEALPNGESFKLRSEVVSEIPPDDTTIEYIEDKKMFIGEELIEIEARNEFTVDVYLDKYVDGKMVGSEKLYTDVYDGNPKKIRVGVLPTPTPEPTPTPKPTQAPPVHARPAPNTEDMP